MDRETYKKAIDSVTFSPDFQTRTEAMLRRRAREQEKENTKMRFMKKPAVIVAIISLLVVSVSAAALYLSPSQVAEEFGRHRLAQAFEGSGAVTVNETVETGDYAVTLLGITSGADLDELNPEDVSHTYAVVALERLDGTPLEQQSFDFMGHTVTALVSGYKPWEVNNWTLHASVTGKEVEGIYYFLLDVGQLGVFADHTVYLAFYTDAQFAPSAEKFTVAADGSITFADSYTGAHAMFVLPLDKSLADPAAAEALLNNPTERSVTPEEEALLDQMRQEAEDASATLQELDP